MGEKFFPDFGREDVAPLARPVIVKYNGRITDQGILVQDVVFEDAGEFLKSRIVQQLHLPGGEILQYDATGVWLKLV